MWIKLLYTTFWQCWTSQMEENEGRNSQHMIIYVIKIQCGYSSYTNNDPSMFCKQMNHENTSCFVVKFNRFFFSSCIAFSLADWNVGWRTNHRAIHRNNVLGAGKTLGRDCEFITPFFWSDGVAPGHPFQIQFSKVCCVLVVVMASEAVLVVH